MLIRMGHISIYRSVLFFLFCILQCCRCLPINFQNDTENISHSYLRDKRLVSLGPGTLTTQKTYQACIAPGNRNGHCKHFSGCFAAGILEEQRPNLPRYMDYMCIIEETYIGICCPDNVVTARSKQAFHDDLASMLPAIASLDDEKEEWDEADENGPSANRTAQGDTSLRKNTTSTKEEIRKPRKPRGCGTTTKTKTRIAGGQPADPKEWPWMAALLRQGAIQYCGGVLITDRHVLTAAHCVYRYKPRDVTVRLGEYDFTTSEETRSLDFMVSEIRIHRDFKLNTYEHDIAIIKITRPTTFNSYIWPICLPPVQQSFENKNAIVTGWGTQYYGGPASTVLLETAVPVWPQERCVRSFTQLIPNTTLCAGAYEGGRDACQGDSGGPLLHQLANGRWVNIGIVSWGIRCGEPGYPGIYTRVSSYLDWIFANTVF